MRKSENTPAVASRPAPKPSKRDAADAMRSATEYLIATRQTERALKAGNCAPSFRLRQRPVGDEAYDIVGSCLRITHGQICSLCLWLSQGPLGEAIIGHASHDFDLFERRAFSLVEELAASPVDHMLNPVSQRPNPSLVGTLC